MYHEMKSIGVSNRVLGNGGLGLGSKAYPLAAGDLHSLGNLRAPAATE